MGVEEGFEYLKDAFVYQEWLGVDWLIPLIIIFMSLLLVTRDVGKWKILSFPMSIAWLIAGLRVHLLVLIVTAILYVVETLSLPMIGKYASIIGGATFGQLGKVVQQRRAPMILAKTIDREHRKREREQEAKMLYKSKINKKQEKIAQRRINAELKREERRKKKELKTGLWTGTGTKKPSLADQIDYEDDKLRRFK